MFGGSSSSRAFCREALLADGSVQLPLGMRWEECFFSAKTDTQREGTAYCTPPGACAQRHIAGLKPSVMQRILLVGSFHQTFHKKQGRPSSELPLLCNWSVSIVAFFSCGFSSLDFLVLEISITLKIKRGSQSLISFCHTNRIGIAEALKPIISRPRDPGIG